MQHPAPGESPLATHRPACRKRGGLGFTLIELLVVISIVTILIALLLPALASARTTAHMTVSLSSLRQLAIAHHTYAGDNRQSLVYLWYDTSTGNHPRPTWAGRLTQRKYVANRGIFWSPARNTSELNFNGDRYNEGDPWHYTGYGMNIWVTANERDTLNPLVPRAPLKLDHTRTPPHSKFLLMAEMSTDNIGSSKPNTLPGFYQAAASTGTSANINLFSYKGASPHAYVDGHASSDSRSIGWIPTSTFYGSWVYTSTGHRRNAPWYWEWWL